MIQVNTFKMKSEWVGTVPAFFYTLIAGALSDDFGRKPLLVIPLIGYLLVTIFQFFIHLYINELPIEAFYILEMFSWCGGR